MSAPVTTIDKMSCTYLVAAQHRAPSAIGSRLDAVAQSRLAERCGSALSALLDPADPSVWLINRLDVGLALSLDDDGEDLLAQAWARGIAERICDVVSGVVSLPAGDVVWFPDRATFLASFAVDAVAGRATGRWEYTSLAGVSALAPGRAITAAAEGQQVPIAAVVQRLAVTSRLHGLAADIEPSDAAQLWESCLAQCCTAEPRSDAARRAVQATCVLHGSASAGQRALRALATALAVLPSADTADAGIALVAGVEGWTPSLSALRVVRADGGTAVDEPGAAAASAAGAPATRPRSPDPAPLRAVIPGPGGAPGRTGRTGPSSVPTPFAGVLRLLPALEDLGWEQLPAPARRQVLRRCLGVAAGSMADVDEVLSLVAGLDQEHEETPPRLLSDGAAVDACLATLVRRARVDGRAVAVTTLPNPRGGGRVLLLRDVESNLWLHCGTAVGSRSRARALDRLHRCGLTVGSIVDDLDRPALDLAFLGADPPAGFSAVAQAAVRLFSLRLLGFGRSSVSHLVDNLLDSPGVLTDLVDRFEVTVQPSALQVLLDLGGLDAFEVSLGWLPKPLRVRTFGGRT